MTAMIPTQSVCKHCQNTIKNIAGTWYEASLMKKAIDAADAILAGACSVDGKLCRHEPVSEPASTGEPSPKVELPKHLWRCIGTNPYTCKDYRCPVHGSGDVLKCTCGTEFELYCPKCDSKNLLHKPNDPLPAGCYCNSGQCMAPVMMGRQMPCRDPEKAQGKQKCCDNGYFGEAHECQKSNPEPARPSEPFEPPRGFDPRPDLNWPLRSMRPAPQASAELTCQKCVEGIHGHCSCDCECRLSKCNLKVSAPQPVSGDAPKVEEIARKIANSIIRPLLHAANDGKKISLNFLDEVALETEAILRPYFAFTPTQKPTSPEDVPDLYRLAYMPGVWRCPKCGFVLSKATISMSSASIGTTPEDRQSEQCPNDGEWMVPVTYKESLKQCQDRLLAELETRNKE